MENVGQKLLQQMKDLEKTFQELKLHYRFGYFCFYGENGYSTPYGQIKPILDVFEDAGFHMEKEAKGDRVNYVMRHSDLQRRFSFEVERRADDAEALRQLLEQQQKIQAQIEKLKNSQEEAV